MKSEELQLKIIPTRNPKPDFYEDYTQVFSCWFGVWTETYRELSGSDHLSSDDFTRQDEALALFSKGKCLGMVFMRNENLDSPAVIHDSYFGSWPAFLVNRLARHGSSMTIVSYLTGSQTARGNPIDGKFKMQEVLMALSALRFLDLKTDVMVATPRVAVGSGNSCKLAGSEVSFMGKQMHGVDIECVEFLPNRVKKMKFSDVVYKLWNERVTYGSNELKYNLELLGG